MGTDNECPHNLLLPIEIINEYVKWKNRSKYDR